MKPKDEELNKRVGLNARLIRAHKGITSISEVARRAGLNQATVSRLEKGKRGLSVYTLIRVAEALEVSLDVLVSENLSTSIDLQPVTNDSESDT